MPNIAEIPKHISPTGVPIEPEVLARIATELAKKEK